MSQKPSASFLELIPTLTTTNQASTAAWGLVIIHKGVVTAGTYTGRESSPYKRH